MENSGKCRKAFELMQKKRLACPLNSGIYKIREVAGRMKSWNEDIDVLIKYRVAGKKPPMGRHSAGEDSHIWLKKIPKYISELMGYEILPGMHALSGDGLSTESVDSITKMYSRKIDGLIDECDRVDWVLRSNKIQHEYMKWNYGQSDLKDLIDLALSIVDEILRSAVIGSNVSHGR